MEWATLLMLLLLVLIVTIAAIGIYDVARTYLQIRDSSSHFSPTARMYLDRRWQEHCERIERKAHK